MIITITLTLFVFTSIMTVFATSASYNDTIPLLSDKTLASGTKSATTNYATNTLNNGSRYYTGWIDYYNGSSWVRVTDKKQFIYGYNGNLNYTATPAVGRAVRLRAGKDLFTAGDWVSGTINFR